MSNLHWFPLALLAAFGAAGVAIFGRVGLAKLDPTLATTLRSILMAAILVAFVLVSGRLKLLSEGGLAAIPGRAWLFIMLAAAAGAVSWLAYFAALQKGAAGPVAAIDRLSVILVFVFAALFLGERPDWRGWIGVTLVAVGLVLIALFPAARQSSVTNQAASFDSPSTAASGS